MNWSFWNLSRTQKAQQDDGFAHEENRFLNIFKKHKDESDSGSAEENEQSSESEYYEKDRSFYSDNTFNEWQEEAARRISANSERIDEHEKKYNTQEHESLQSPLPEDSIYEYGSSIRSRKRSAALSKSRSELQEDDLKLNNQEVLLLDIMEQISKLEEACSYSPTPFVTDEESQKFKMVNRRNERIRGVDRSSYKEEACEAARAHATRLLYVCRLIKKLAMDAHNAAQFNAALHAIALKEQQMMKQWNGSSGYLPVNRTLLDHIYSEISSLQAANNANYRRKVKHLNEEVQSMYEAITTAVCKGIDDCTVPPTLYNATGVEDQVLEMPIINSRYRLMPFLQKLKIYEMVEANVEIQEELEAQLRMDTFGDGHRSNGGSTIAQWNPKQNVITRKNHVKSTPTGFTVRSRKEDIETLEQRLDGKWGSYRLFEQWLHDAMKWQWMDFQMQRDFCERKSELENLKQEKKREILQMIDIRMKELWEGRMLGLYELEVVNVVSAYEKMFKNEKETLAEKKMELERMHCCYEDLRSNCSQVLKEKIKDDFNETRWNEKISISTKETASSTVSAKNTKLDSIDETSKKDNKNISNSNIKGENRIPEGPIFVPRPSSLQLNVGSSAKCYTPSPPTKAQTQERTLSPLKPRPGIQKHLKWKQGLFSKVEKEKEGVTHTKNMGNKASAQDSVKRDENQILSDETFVEPPVVEEKPSSKPTTQESSITRMLQAGFRSVRGIDESIVTQKEELVNEEKEQVKTPLSSEKAISEWITNHNIFGDASDVSSNSDTQEFGAHTQKQEQPQQQLLQEQQKELQSHRSPSRGVNTTEDNSFGMTRRLPNAASVIEDPSIEMKSEAAINSVRTSLNFKSAVESSQIMDSGQKPSPSGAVIPQPEPPNVSATAADGRTNHTYAVDENEAGVSIETGNEGIVSGVAVSSTIASQLNDPSMGSTPVLYTMEATQNEKDFEGTPRDASNGGGITPNTAVQDKRPPFENLNEIAEATVHKSQTFDEEVIQTVSQQTTEHRANTSIEHDEKTDKKIGGISDGNAPTSTTCTEVNTTPQVQSTISDIQRDSTHRLMSPIQSLPSCYEDDESTEVEASLVAETYRKYSDFFEVLHTISFFKTFDDIELNKILDSFKSSLLQLPKKCVLIEKGEALECLFFLVKGSMERLEEFENDITPKVLRHGRFLEAEAFVRGSSSPHTWRSTTPCTLYKLTKQSFAGHLSGMQSRHMEDLKNYLLLVPLVLRLSDEELTVLLYSLTIVQYADGESIHIYGDRIRELSVVVAGTGAMRRTVDPQTGGHTAVTCRAGDFWGETSLVDEDEGESMIVTAEGRYGCTIASISKSDFEARFGNAMQIMQRDPRKVPKGKSGGSGVRNFHDLWKPKKFAKFQKHKK